MSLKGKFRPILVPTLLILIAGLVTACGASSGEPPAMPTQASTMTPSALPTALPTALPAGLPTPTTLPAPSPTPSAAPMGIQNAGSLRIAGDFGAGSLGQIAASPDGKWIAIAGSRGLWLIDKFTFDVAARITSHAGAVLQAAWDPTGYRLASSGADGTVRVWDLTEPANPRQLALLVGHTGPVRALAWSSDGARIASGGDDQAIRIWNTQSFKNTLTLSHTSAIYALDWHPASGLLLIGEFDGSISVTDGLSGENFASFEAHDGWIRSARWSPDGASAVTGGLDRTLRVWDLQPDFSLESRLSISTAFSIHVSAWAPSGDRIAAAGGTPFSIAFFDPTESDGESPVTPDVVLEGSTGSIDGLAFAPGGVLLSAGQDNALRAWNLRSGEAIRFLKHTGAAAISAGLNAVDVSPDGLTAATGGFDGTLRTWDLATGETRILAAAHSGQVTSLDWSPGGSWIATGGSDNFTRLWDAATGELVQEVRSEGGQVNAVAFSPFGNLLASGGFFRIVQVWTAGTDMEPLLLYPDVEITALGWASSGLVLAVGGNDGSVRLYNGQTGAEISLLENEHNTNIIAIRWEPLGGRIAALDRRGTIAVWESGTGEMLARRPGDGRIWSGLAWAPQGLLAAGNDSGEILIFDSASLAPAARLAGHSTAVNALSLNEPGDRLVSVDSGGGLLTWETAIPFATPLVLEAPVAGEPGAMPESHPAAEPISLENAAGARQLSVLGRGTALATAGSADLFSVGSGTGAWIYRGPDQAFIRYLEGGRTFGTAWSPNGRLLAARELQLVRVWDVETAQVLRAFPVGLGVRDAMAWSPDGLLLAVGDRQGEVSVFGMAGGEKLLGWNAGFEIRALAWQAGGRYLAAAAGNDIVLWDIAAGEQAALLRGHETAVLSLAFHPSENLLLSAGEKESLRIWDLDALTKPETPPEGEDIAWPEVPSDALDIAGFDPATALAWSADGSVFFSAHGELVILTWGSRTREIQDSITVEQIGGAGGLRLLADGTIIPAMGPRQGHFPSQVAFRWLSSESVLGQGEDGFLRLFNPSSGGILEGPESLTAEPVLNLIPGGPHITVRTDRITRYDLSGVLISETEPSPALAGLSTTDWIAAVSPDGSLVAAVDPTDTPANIAVFEAETGAIRFAFPLEPDIQATYLAWSPDGARLAAGQSDGSVRTWNAITGDAAGSFDVFAQRVNGLAWSPDGARIAAAGSDGSENGGFQVIRLVDAANGRLLQEYALDFARTALVLAFSPGGDLLASGDSGGGVQIWDAATGGRLSDLSGHKLGVTGIAFSPDGSELATSSRDGTIRIWGIGE